MLTTEKQRAPKREREREGLGSSIGYGSREGSVEVGSKGMYHFCAWSAPGLNHKCAQVYNTSLDPG